MSDSSQTIVDIEAGAEEAESLAAGLRHRLVGEGIIAPEASDSVLGTGPGHRPGQSYAGILTHGAGDGAFLQLLTNGVEFQVGRRVFDAGANGIGLVCASCHREFEPGPEWDQAVSAWVEGDAGASFACPACGRVDRLAEWRGPHQWGFGHVGITFWNWPPLADGFIRAVSDQLGHRTVLVRQHL